MIVIKLKNQKFKVNGVYLELDKIQGKRSLPLFSLPLFTLEFTFEN